LRLLPGMIVREQSTGNFDVHIRGLDNIPPGNLMLYSISTTMLVMIDYRVVYNYLQGGTYWETLPIDIIDVERIELVRGPVAALYGPNAVTGVINIITRKFASNGPHASARIEGALSSRDNDWTNNFRLGQRLISGRLGYKHDSFSFGLSGNYLSFDRLEGGLYSYYLQRRVAPKELVTSFFKFTPKELINPDVADDMYPEPNLARRSAGVNAFAAYEPNKKLSFILTGGYQEDRTLREYIDLWYSPMNTHEGRSWYLDLRSHAYNFTFQASFAAGDTLVPGDKVDFPDGITRENYASTYYTLDLILDYDFIWEWLRVRPGVSFRHAQYSGPSFYQWDENNQLIDDTAIRQSAAASVGLEQSLWKKLRFIEAVRLDVYFDRTENNYYPSSATPGISPEPKHGQTLYPSFQFAVTYTPAEDHILRATYGRANKSPTMVGSFLYLKGPTLLARGNNASDLVLIDTLELGYRTRITHQIDMSVEVFGNYARDFESTFIQGRDKNNLFIIQLKNISLKAWQLGATVSAGYTGHRLQGRLFVTVQQTRLENLDPNMYRLYDIMYIALDPGNKKNLINARHEGTPDLYGGFYVNYLPIEKLNINLNAYYLSRHTQIHDDLPSGIFPTYSEALSGRVPIEHSFLLNAKVSYNFWNGLSASINVRNLFNINQAQFAWGDANHILCFIGLQYDL
jgi:iron complex outermembrane receptor protein